MWRVTALLNSCKGVGDLGEDVRVLVDATGVGGCCVNVRIGVAEPGGCDVEG